MRGLTGVLVLVLVLAVFPLMAQAGDVSVEIYADSSWLNADEDVVVAGSQRFPGAEARRNCNAPG